MTNPQTTTEPPNDWAIEWLKQLSLWFCRRAGASQEDMKIQAYIKNAENALRIADIVRGKQ